MHPSAASKKIMHGLGFLYAVMYGSRFGGGDMLQTADFRGTRGSYYYTYTSALTLPPPQNASSFGRSVELHGLVVLENV